tara:strand:+ start:2235 stop:2624 length:390 start_codon:yes stop_codon:yes gene_type:complete
METRQDELQAEFDRYHQDNPQVYEAFKRLTFQLISAGRENFSASAVVERIRWGVSIGEYGPDDFKINNNYRAFYARLFHVEHPNHDGFFRTRKQKSADEDATNLPPLKRSWFDEMTDETQQHLNSLRIR